MIGENSFFAQYAAKYIAKYQFMSARTYAIQPLARVNPIAASVVTPATLSAPATLQATVAPLPDAPNSSQSQNSIPLAPTTEETATPKQIDKADISSADPAKTDKTIEEALYTKLRYKLRLGIDLRALEETATNLVQRGDAASGTIERLSVAQLGLHVDFKLSGLQIQKTLTEQQGSPEVATANSGEIAATAMQLPETARATYTTAVSRFAFRYRSDSQFSFSHFSRFQSQVTKVAEKDPQAVAPYSATAGELAMNAPDSVMGQFFDAVDSYLSGSEESLVATIREALTSAQEQLHLSEDAINSMAEHLEGTIHSFFDSAEAAVSAMRTQFGSIANAPNATPVVNPIPSAPTILDESNEVPTAPPLVDPQAEILKSIIESIAPTTPKSATPSLVGLA